MILSLRIIIYFRTLQLPSFTFTDFHKYHTYELIHVVIELWNIQQIR